MNLKTKKAQSSNLLLGLIGGTGVLVVVVLLLSLSGDINNELREQAISEATATTVTNETVTWTNNTDVALANSARSVALSCTTVRTNETGALPTNSSANTTLTTGNYSCGTEGFRMLNTNDGTFNLTSSVIINYSFTAPDEQVNITSGGTGGLVGLSDQFTNIGTILGLTAVIGLLAGLFVLLRSRD